MPFFPLSLSTMSGSNALFVMSTLDGIILSCVSVLCSFSRIGLGLCFHDCSGTRMLKCLQMCQWIQICQWITSPDSVMSLCVLLLRHEFFFTFWNQVTGTFSFYPTKPAFVWLAQSSHFLKGISVVSLVLSIYDDSFSIPIDLTSS